MKINNANKNKSINCEILISLCSSLSLSASKLFAFPEIIECKPAFIEKDSNSDMASAPPMDSRDVKERGLTDKVFLPLRNMPAIEKEADKKKEEKTDKTSKLIVVVLWLLYVTFCLHLNKIVSIVPFNNVNYWCFNS